MEEQYQQTLDFLYSQLPMYQRVGAKAFKKDLNNIIALCNQLEQPQEAFPSIHIAGTNGKGSTAHLIAAILQASGLKVGLYTSPHYRDFRERIKINGEYISHEAVINFVKQYKPAFTHLKPSYFEITVAMAFEYFKNEAVDIAVIETGLGGRLDSTNIITPLLSVITNIGFDHTNFLGDTLPLIASEKAGIIKNEIPVVIGQRHKETTPVFVKKAQEQDAPIYFAEDLIKLTLIQKKLEGNIYLYNKEPLVSDLWGDYQRYNVRTALAAIDVLNKYTDYRIYKNVIKLGISQTKMLTNMIGRWQKLGDSPLILTDSGHNEDGVKQVVSQLSELSFENLHLVWGAVNDKDITSILTLLPTSATYYFAKPNIPRGLAADKLQQQAAKLGLQGNIYTSVNKALAAAKKAATPQDLIFVGGSTFVVAEVV